MIPLDLAGAVIAVTGAASGIGFHISGKIIEAGGTPLMLDIDRNALLRSATGLFGSETEAKPHIATVDVSDFASIEAALARLEATHGPVTHAVANAGINPPAGTLDITDAQWKRVLSVNLDGQFYTCRAVGRRLADRRAGKGAMVTVSSLAGFNGKHDRVAYCASKGAIVNMTRAMALDLGKHGIRVNGVAPGIILTAQQARNSSSYRDMQAGRAALGRNGTADEVANVVLFLLSDLASFVTGETIVIDGGLTARYA